VLLKQALQQTEALADTARRAQAMAAEVDKQKTLFEDTLSKLQQAGLLVSAPAGVGIVSGTHLQVSAADNLIVTAGGNADIGVMKAFTVAAGEAVSLFAQKLGMKLFAANGKLQIQAQGDAMELSAQKDVTVTSVDGKLILTAAKEVWIGAGGSYIKINGNRIEYGTPGDIYEKCAWWGQQGPSSISEAMNASTQATFDEQLSLRWPYDGAPMRNQKFALVRPDKTVIRGVTDADGNTSLQKSLWVEGMHLRLDP
jgi:type VI secretion system secreted protein VgrG